MDDASLASTPAPATLPHECAEVRRRFLEARILRPGAQLPWEPTGVSSANAYSHDPTWERGALTFTHEGRAWRICEVWSLRGPLLLRTEGEHGEGARRALRAFADAHGYTIAAPAGRTLRVGDHCAVCRAPAATVAEVAQRVLHSLRVESATAKDLAVSLGVGESILGKALVRLEGDGLVWTDGGGRYCAPSVARRGLGLLSRARKRRGRSARLGQGDSF